MVEAKRTKEWKKRIGTAIVAAFLLGGLWLWIGPGVHGEEKTQTASIVMLGDSIWGECRDETSVSTRLSAMLKMDVFNGALGGTSTSYIDGEKSLTNTKDCLSFQALSQAIATGDFGVQQTIISRESMTDYFEDTIDALEQIDFSRVDILLLNHGINDYHAGIAVDNPKDPYDRYTYLGGLRYGISLLQETYPNLRIILVTSSYTWYPTFHDVTELTCENYDREGHFLEEYVNAQLALAQEMDLEVIDLYHGGYPHETFGDWERYTIDGVHPNDAGREFLAEKLYAYLKEDRR